MDRIDYCSAAGTRLKHLIGGAYVGQFDEMIGNRGGRGEELKLFFEITFPATSNSGQQFGWVLLENEALYFAAFPLAADQFQ